MLQCKYYKYKSASVHIKSHHDICLELPIILSDLLVENKDLRSFVAKWWKLRFAHFLRKVITRNSCICKSRDDYNGQDFLNFQQRFIGGFLPHWNWNWKLGTRKDFLGDKPYFALSLFLHFHVCKKNTQLPNELLVLVFSVLNGHR